MAEGHGSRRGVRLSSGDLEGLIDNFLGGRDNQRLSRSERERCHQLLTGWRSVMAEQGGVEIKKIRKVHLKRWLEALPEEPSSLYSAACVRLLFAHAVQRHRLPAGRNHFESLSPPRLSEEALLDDDQRVLLEKLEAIPTDNFENIRDRAFLRVAYVTKIWLGGLVALDLYEPGNLRNYTVLPEGVIRYRAGSGQTQMEAVDAKTMEWIEAWLEVRGNYLSGPPVGPLWISRRGERVRRASMAPRIRKLETTYGLV